MVNIKLITVFSIIYFFPANIFGQAMALAEKSEVKSRNIQIKKGQTLLIFPVDPSISGMIKTNIKSDGKASY